MARSSSLLCLQQTKKAGYLSQNTATYTIRKVSNMLLVRYVEKTKYIVMSRNENVGENHDVKINNKSFERMKQLKYLGNTLTNQNSSQEEIGAD